MEDIIFERNMMDVVLFLAYIFGIAYLVQRFRILSKKIYLLAIYIGIIHLVLTIIYYFDTFAKLADAKGYYLNVMYNYDSFTETSFATGSLFIDMFLYPLVHAFSLSYLGCFFVFSFISLMGVYKLYEILLKINDFKWTNWYYLMLLPSMHYWTSSIGKDSLIFMSICYLLNAYFFKRSYKSYILPLLLIGLVRFYILAFIGAGFFLALILLSKQIKLGYKIVLMGIFVVVVVLVMPFFFDSISFSGVEDIEQKKEIIQRANMDGGGAINLSNANIAVKWFSYVFRPFIFEAKSVFSLMAAIENILWMIIFYMMYMGIKRRKTRMVLDSFFWVCFVCIFTITLPPSYLLSNLGIASRQKIMIFPFLLIVFFLLYKTNKLVSIAKKLRVN